MNSVDSNQRHFRAKSPTSAVNPVLCAVVLPRMRQVIPED